MDILHSIPSYDKSHLFKSSYTNGHLGFIHVFVIRNRYYSEQLLFLPGLHPFLPAFDKNTLLLQWKSTISSVLLHVVKVGSTLFPLPPQGHDSSQVNQRIPSPCPGELGQRWVLD